MSSQHNSWRHAALLAALFVPGWALATNGYFSHGVGVKSDGLAGVGIALPQDALAAATNPAGTGEAGDRVDLGLTWFAPSRSADIVGNAFGPDAHYSGDGKKNFFIPEFGVQRRLSNTLAAGLAVYGNGGMNTQYDANPYARFGGNGTAGVNLEQLFITPSLAWKASDSHTLGLALNLAYQRFAAQGVGVFAGFSSAPANVSDQGTDSTTGAGVRLGWRGTLAPGLVLGATWASKIHGRFSKYRGLFADGGGFDVPENYGLGLAWQAAKDWTVAADVQTIRYSQVGSVGNSVASLFQGAALGASHGPGFGWRDVTAVKLGAEHQLQAGWVLRAGLSHANQPVPAGETFFNILAPGVVQDHLSLGATWALTGSGEVSAFYTRGFGKTVNGAGSIPPGLPAQGGFGGGNANVRLQENLLGMDYSWKL